MKKKILFVIESLGFGGAERSLINLLKKLDYSRYEVDLQLFQHNFEWRDEVESKVNILPLSSYAEFLNFSWGDIIKTYKHWKIKWIIARLRYSLYIRNHKKANREELQKAYWEIQKQCFDTNSKFYDIAIAYSQGIPTFYTSEKIKSARKITWLNVKYDLDDSLKSYNLKYYRQFDFIVAVSDYVRNHFITSLYPELSKKVRTIYDIVDPDNILKKSKEKITDIKKGRDEILIVTVGRYNWQKGYDYAIDAAEILKNDGINFRWIAIGEGPLHETFNEKIKERGLSSIFILTGNRKNPYPYMAMCDIYVQTSRMEGFGLTITEARILGKPIVVTDFNTARLQIENNVNGLISTFDPKDIANNIKVLIHNKKLRSKLTIELNKEIFENHNELAEFYNLLSD